MRILIVGGGGREHALAWKIAQSPRLTALYCIPGNPGMDRHAQRVKAPSGRIEDIASWAKKNRIDLVVVGPEAPLADGIIDLLGREGVCGFGPSRAAARIESSKVFARQLMKRYSLPTPDFEVCKSPDEARAAIDRFSAAGKKIVVKADGLAAGKGSIVTETRQEALAAVQKIMVEMAFGTAGRQVVIEERLRGPEASILAIVDGERIVVLPASQDHKPIGEGNTGPNTGGMGAYSPVPMIRPDLTDTIINTIIKPIVRGLSAEGCPYRGTLYAGLMIVDGNPYVIEFNCRFGDPESQAVLPVLGEDLLPLLDQAARGRLESDRVIPARGAALCVVMASGGYPGPYEKGRVIHGLEKDLGEGVTVFHAGTAEGEGGIVTAGGRVLGVTGVGKDLQQAAQRAYAAVREISFDGAYYRRDIGYRAMEAKEAT